MNPDIVTRATRVWEVDWNYQLIDTRKVLKGADATPESDFVEGTRRREADGYTHELKKADRAAYPRRKRRVIFGDVGLSLDQVLSYADFTKGLAQLVYGLDFMRLAGFVHGNISPGNCLVYNGQAKISDLEYARPYAAPSPPLTGTPEFMAVEHQFRSHLFIPQPPPMHIFPGESPPPMPPSWFKYNFLHDLESVLWIYLWFLLETLPKAFTVAQIAQHKTAILRLHHLLFDFSPNVSAQRLFLIQNCATNMACAYGDVVDALTEVHGVDSKLVQALQAFQSLSSCYRIVESSTPLMAESPQWDQNVFLPKYHQAIRIYFLDAHEQMKDKSDEAKRLSDSLREAKQRIKQLAETRKPSATKRPRMCEDNEAYSPCRAVRPDEAGEDAASDSSSYTSPSPTEEIQVGENQRKRA